jgi:oligopeptide transport system substrate-binding protein
MIRSLILKIFLCLSLFLTACQKKGEEELGQHLRINVVDELQSLDPRKARDLNSIAVMKMIYEGLTRISKEGKTELALAKSVTISNDKRTYIFKLRDSFWTDGTPLTSYDFATSWKQVLDPSFPATMSYKLFIIEGAKEAKEGKATSDKIAIFTPDKYTLIVKLTQPAPYFLELLSMPVSFPVAERLTKQASVWEENEGLYLGNGPFKIVTWKHHNLLELKQNDKYWDRDAVKLKKLSLFMVSAETELNMFETKKIDWAGSPLSTLPVDAIKSLSNLNNFVKQPFLGTSFIRINTEWSSSLFETDQKALLFRKALAYSIERENIAIHVMHGCMEKAGGFLPPNLRGREFLDKIDNKLINEFKDLGFAGTIKLSFVNNDRNNMVVQALQRGWEEKLNLKVELEPLERKVYLQKLATGNYQLALGSWIADFNDIMNFLEVFKFKNNGTNNTFWENTEYIDLLNRADICINDEERNDYLQRAHKILMDEMPIIPIFHLNMCYLKNEDIKDVVISPVGSIDYRWAYYTEPN